jgi:hypothetical protein
MSTDNEIDLGQDLGGIDRGKSSDIIPKGEYLVEIVGCRKGEAKETGKPYIGVEYAVRADTQGGRFVDSVFFETYSLEPQALWKIASLLDAVFGQVFKGRKFPVKEVVGKRLVVHTYIDDYGNQDRTRTQKFVVASKFSGGKANAAGAGKGTSPNEEVNL